MEITPVILIVDDTPSGQQALGSLLRSQDYQLAFADNGPDALRLATDLQPDIILLDIMMPGMDGYEVLRRLRSDPRLAEVPVVMVTALDDIDSRIQGFEAGADDFISKPFNRAELRARIRTITRLNRYRTLTEEREKLRQLSHQMIDLQERERRSIAMELHDEIGQELTGLKHLIQQTQISTSDPQRQVLLDQGIEIAGRLIHRVRTLSLRLRPSMLDDLGLYPALWWLISQTRERTGLEIDCNFTEFDEGRFLPAIETAIFRIAQEALTNITRHANARCVSLRLLVNADSLLFEICDDGQGFDPGALSKQKNFSSGLSGMQERARMVGGELQVDSSPGNGTSIMVTFPTKGVTHP